MYDVFIVGGGVAGATLAKRICQVTSSSASGLTVGLLDARPKPPPPLSDLKEFDKDYPTPRSYALSPSSLRILGEEVVVKALHERQRFAPYKTMQVWESNGPGVLKFNAQDLLEDSTVTNEESSHLYPRGSILGAVLEDGPLVSCLWDFLRNHQDVSASSTNSTSLDLITGAKVTHINNARSDATGLNSTSSTTPRPMTLTYQNLSDKSTHRIQTRLLVAADGAFSQTRQALSIPTFQWQYGRQAVTTTLQLAPGEEMHATAFQRFFPDGPLALLPVWSNPQEGAGDSKEKRQERRFANVIWSTTPHHAKHLTSLSRARFAAAVNEALRVGPQPSPSMSGMQQPESPSWFRGPMTALDEMARAVGEGLAMVNLRDDPFVVPPLLLQEEQKISNNCPAPPKIFAFPLALQQAQRYVAPRAVLIGDAAHTVHPLAGQGLNLGLGDVEQLATGVIAQAAESGMDVGESMLLETFYEKPRKMEVGVKMGGIHALHEVFGMDYEKSGIGVGVVPAMWARSVGMNMVHAAGPVRRQLARMAAGY